MPDVHVTQSALAVYLIVGLIGAAALLASSSSLVAVRRRPAARAKSVGHDAPAEHHVDDKTS